MKILKSFWLAAVLLLTAQVSFAQKAPAAAAKGKGPATEVFQIKTSAVCDMCKTRLEKALAYEKGVQQAQLDVPSKVLTVSYRPDKTSPAALRTAVQRTGYDADDQVAEIRAYDRLPDCCKKTNSVHQDAAH
ncbi:heavy-metal-associated domain-containing protein [Hymenobacter cellulosilyticus]|uniref:Heavy-metal-associated domain-containing protein n=1 Tax=Hymenobacter cellulosilyticus TaxID=2932248 RepID=A0A8T9QC30_9BACT|nr:heavy metal-associated domain-containing protein [Hymenobacter cellulosilyticus]UOQ74755.1 heavy-metal-associated domain-containing protein [Hymenobacter cellulosilyticus]